MDVNQRHISTRPSIGSKMGQHRAVWAADGHLTLWCALIALAAFAGYQYLFSTFAPYDDEGYVMISLRSQMAGHALYDETFSQYGPAFYVVQSAIHRLLNLPITHEVTRLKTLLLWLVVSGVCAAVVVRLTGGLRWIGPITFMAVFLHLDKLPLETGHPQELCVLCVALILLAATWLDAECGRTRAAAWLAIGFISGILLLTKINLGVLAILSLATAFAAVARPGWLRNTLAWATYSSLVLLPWFLFRHQLASYDAIRLPLVTCAASLGVLIVARRLPFTRLSLWQSAWPLSSFVMVVASLLSLVVIQGTTVAGLTYGLVGQHSDFVSLFFHSPPLNSLALPAAVCLLMMASSDRRSIIPLRITQAFAVCMLGLVAWTFVVESGKPLVHGLEPRGATGLLMAVGPGLLWALLRSDARDREGLPPSIARLVLALIAVLQPLGVYPTPGTQVAIGSLPLLIACIVLTADGCRYGFQLSRQRSTTASFHGLTVLPICLMVLLTITIVIRDVAVFRYRMARTPLDLPGTGDLRLDGQFVQRQRWLVETLRRDCDTFLFAHHARNSLYFWAEIDPPTNLNATFWPYMLNAEMQQRVVRSLDRYDRVCVVREPFDSDLPDSLLLTHFNESFRPVAAHGSAEVLYDIDRTMTIPTSHQAASESASR